MPILPWIFKHTQLPKKQQDPSHEFTFIEEE